MDARRALALSYWKVLVVLVVPLVLLPIPLLWQPEQGAAISRTLYVIVVMAVYWVTEALPLTVTALVPLLAFPVLRITPAKQVATHYLNDSSWLFIGSLVVAVAVEDTGLHRRIALNILRVTGSQPRWLMIGIMCCTSLLSMFISNTATTAMMVPVVLSLAAELIRTERRVEPKAAGVQLKRMHRVAPAQQQAGRTADAADKAASGEPAACDDVERSPGAHVPSADEDAAEEVVMERSRLSPAELRLTKALLLATSYSASLGGTATLTGTPPNIVMKGLLDDKYGDGHPINYATWIAYNGPGMLINIAFAWHWLQLVFFGPRALVSCRRQSAAAVQAVRSVISREVALLGRWTFAEISILCWFAVALLLWLTREIAGWGSLFDGSSTKNVTHTNGSWSMETTAVPYVSDGTCIILICLVLFIWPRHMPLKRESKEGERRRYALAPFAPLLTWQAVQQRLPWGVVLLLGGGFALAKASQSSGLSALIASQLAELDLSPFWICMLSLVLMTYLTEFTSNTATSQIVLPITMDLAQMRCFNPLYLTMPVSEAASFAYMLPVATPPNAIVFSSGLLTVIDMMLAGSVMNIFCMFEVLLSIHTWGWHMFGIASYPKWAVLPNDNATLTCYLQHGAM